MVVEIVERMVVVWARVDGGGGGDDDLGQG